MLTSIHVAQKNKTVFVRCSEKSAGQYGIISTKSGFIEVDSVENANKLKAAIDSNELAVVFGSQDQQGNYNLTVLPSTVPAEATLETA